MVNMSTQLSYRQARLNVVQEMVWRDMHFIATLRGKPCCLLADSTPVSDNRELTAYLVSWVEDTSLKVYPIHVSVESGKNSEVLITALKRQMEYFKQLNDYLALEGCIEADERFDLECLTSTFTDRGSVVMGLANKISSETQRSLLRMYELQHRTHITDSAVAQVFAPGMPRPFRGPTYQAIKVAYLFVSNNDAFSTWLHNTHQAAPIKWITRVTYGRFSSFGSAAWVLLSPVARGSADLWTILTQYLTAYPTLSQTEAYGRLREWLADNVVKERVNAILAVYLKVSLPFSRRAARVITYADAQCLVRATAAAFKNWDSDKVGLFFSEDTNDVYGQAVQVPRPGCLSGDTERCRAIARCRMMLGCRETQLCAGCQQLSSGEPVVQCDGCQQWYHLQCQRERSFELCRIWHCSMCSAPQPPANPGGDQYVPPIAVGAHEWRTQIVKALDKSYTLEERFWQEGVDHSVMRQSLACPFSATATEGPIGVLKDLSCPSSGRRVECMLRALLTARRYDAGEQSIERAVPFMDHRHFVSTIGRVLLLRDCQAVRKRERGESVLALLEERREKIADRDSKRARVEEAMSGPVDDPEAVAVLSQIRGSTNALAKQAELRGVTVGKTKGETTRRIVAAIQASQDAEEANVDEDDEGNEDHNADDDETEYVLLCRCACSH